MTEEETTERRPAPVTPLVRIVDDEPGIRRALAVLLEAEGYEVACFPSAESFLSEDVLSKPGCLILDIRMPGMSGPELQQELVNRSSALPIIFLTAFADVDTAVNSMKLGAVDFLQKPVDEEKLLTAVARALRNSTSGEEKKLAELQERLATLTPREREIVRLASLGLLNSAIAERLGIGLRTVKFHRAGAYRKLGIHTAAELAQAFSNLRLQK